MPPAGYQDGWDLSLSDTGRPLLLFIDEIEISEIDKIPGEISQDKDWVHPMDGVK